MCFLYYRLFYQWVIRWQWCSHAHTTNTDWSLPRFISGLDLPEALRLMLNQQIISVNIIQTSIIVSATLIICSDALKYCIVLCLRNNHTNTKAWDSNDIRYTASWILERHPQNKFDTGPDNSAIDREYWEEDVLMLQLNPHIYSYGFNHGAASVWSC